MFNFTTQTIFNSLVQWDKDTVNPKANLIIPEESDENPQLRVGNLRFDAKNIVSVEKKLPSEVALSHVTFDMSKFDTGVTAINENLDGKTVTARLALYVGLTQTSVDSFYANSFVYKGKPFYVEFPYTVGAWTDDEKATLKKVAKVVLTNDAPILTVDVDEDDKIVITCTNGYQILREAIVQVYDPTQVNIDCCNAEGGFTNVLKATLGTLTFEEESDEALLVPVEESDESDEVIYPGAEAFADYAWMVHNLRLPTCANYNYWSANKAELPAPSGRYIQYTVKLCADRENIGGMVVGEKTHSVTTHVLYVLNTLDVSALEDAFTAILGASNTLDEYKQILHTADDKLKGE